MTRSAATERLLPHEGDCLSAVLVLFGRLAVGAALYVGMINAVCVCCVLCAVFECS